MYLATLFIITVITIIIIIVSSLCPDINGALHIGHPLYSKRLSQLFITIIIIVTTIHMIIITSIIIITIIIITIIAITITLIVIIAILSEQQAPILKARKLAISGENLLPAPRISTSMQGIYQTRGEFCL